MGSSIASTALLDFPLLESISIFNIDLRGATIQKRQGDSAISAENQMEEGKGGERGGGGGGRKDGGHDNSSLDPLKLLIGLRHLSYRLPLSHAPPLKLPWCPQCARPTSGDCCGRVFTKAASLENPPPRATKAVTLSRPRCLLFRLSSLDLCPLHLPIDANCTAGCTAGCTADGTASDGSAEIGPHRNLQPLTHLSLGFPLAPGGVRCDGR